MYKEEAKKLYFEIYYILLEECSVVSDELYISLLSKKLSLITVNKIIEVTHSDSRANSQFDKEYWLKVKQYIEEQL